MWLFTELCEHDLKDVQCHQDKPVCVYHFVSVYLFLKAWSHVSQAGLVLLPSGSWTWTSDPLVSTSQVWDCRPEETILLTPLLKIEARVLCKLSKHSYCDTPPATWFSILTRKAEVFDPFTEQQTASWKHMDLSQTSDSQVSCSHTWPECLGSQSSSSLTPE